MAVAAGETRAATGGLARLSEEVEMLAARISASVVLVRGATGSGSGVVWRDDGLIVTNHHVVPGDQAEIVFMDGSHRPAHLTARSREMDLAALRLDRLAPPGSLHAASIGDSRALRVGDLVLAVGNPGGERNAATVGVVCAPRAQHLATDALRLALTLRPGNSGGALADARGRVVGIPHMVAGGGLAYAIPSHVVDRFLLGEVPDERGATVEVCLI
jgi:serine protease Do